MNPELTRRQFVRGAGAAGLGLLAGCGRLPWQAQSPTKVHQIGYLTPDHPTTPLQPAMLQTFREGLTERGWVEGETFALDYRSAETDLTRLPALADELINAGVDVILVHGNPAAQAARQMNASIPIVMVVSSDPVRGGQVESLARPGGNITGVTSLAGLLGGKRLEILKETLPGLSHVAVIWNPALAGREHEFTDLAEPAQTLGLQLQSLEVRAPDDYAPAFQAATEQGAEALLTIENSLTISYPDRILDYAARSRLPSMFAQKSLVAAGGLMAYGANLVANYRRAAYYVDRILKGAKPADLPVEQPMTFDFVVNMKTARELGITFPREVLLQVTEVVE